MFIDGANQKTKGTLLSTNMEPTRRSLLKENGPNQDLSGRFHVSGQEANLANNPLAQKALYKPRYPQQWERSLKNAPNHSAYLGKAVPQSFERGKNEKENTRRSRCETPFAEVPWTKTLQHSDRFPVKPTGERNKCPQLTWHLWEGTWKIQFLLEGPIPFQVPCPRFVGVQNSRSSPLCAKMHLRLYKGGGITNGLLEVGALQIP